LQPTKSKEEPVPVVVGSYLTNSLKPPAPPPSHHRAPRALAGPDSAALRRTVWFCCRV
jgi:hypothetical protein